MKYEQITIEKYMIYKEMMEHIKNCIEQQKADIDYWTKCIQTSIVEEAIQESKNRLKYWENKLEYWENKLLKGDY